MTNVTIVEDVGQLVKLFEEWHGMRIRGLMKIIQAGEGTTIQTEQGPLILTGDSLLAFRTGVQLCLELFGDIPLLDGEELHNSGPYVH